MLQLWNVGDAKDFLDYFDGLGPFGSAETRRTGARSNEDSKTRIAHQRNIAFHVPTRRA